MDEAGVWVDRSPGTALVGPASGSRCLHRVAREHRHGRDWWRGAPLDEGVRLRAVATADRRAALRAQVGERAGADITVVDPAGELWSDLPGGRPGPDDETATLDALAAGATLIWGAALPADPASGREGVRCTLAALPSGGYAPVLVVNHKVLDPRRGRAVAPALVTRLPRWDPTPDPELRVRRHPGDPDRLAHARRLLEAVGHAASRPVGAVLGAGSDRAVVHELGPVLDAADRVHATRLAAARGELATAPSRIGECRTCPWWRGWHTGDGAVTGCREQLVAVDDVSLVVGGGNVTPLREAGIRTVEQLSTAATRPVGWHGEPFADAVLRARARRVGRVLVAKVAGPRIPRADVEVDVDLESHLDDGAYLWGTLLTIRDGRGVDDEGFAPGYRPFVTWAQLPDPDEGRSFAEFWAWLTALRGSLARQGRSFRAYCYSRSAENAWMLSTATRFGPDATRVRVDGVPGVREVREFLSSGEWVDVHEAVTTQFVSTAGMGLKVVAPEAGFSWRDPEPGGEASLGWYRDAQESAGRDREAARRRILQYNEDDVRATRAVRDWIECQERHAFPQRIL